MAEIAEGFSINATIILDAYSLSYVIGEIKHPKVSLSQDAMMLSADLILDTSEPLSILGDFTRSNKGSQGYTVKASAILDDNDTAYNIADISHGKCVIRDDNNTTLALIKLDDKDINLYLGDFIRSNSGSHGFTIKSVLELDDNDVTAYFGDISHGKCRISTDENNLTSSLILDEISLDDFLGDFCRKNKGQQGFTICSKVILGSSDNNDIIADIFRKNDPKYESTARILAYNGRYYLIYTNDCLHYFITKTGDE